MSLCETCHCYVTCKHLFTSGNKKGHMEHSSGNQISAGVWRVFTVPVSHQLQNKAHGIEDLGNIMVKISNE